MAAPGDKMRQRELSPGSASESNEVRGRKPTDNRPEEIEPLDEKSLEQVMRDCPL
jgi:hypothetical protein